MKKPKEIITKIVSVTPKIYSSPPPAWLKECDEIMGFASEKTPNSVNWTDMYEECMKQDTMEKMQGWFKTEVSNYAILHSVPENVAEEIIKKSLGYMTGYYGADGPNHLEYLYNWLGIVHPLFGTPDKMRAVTPEEALEAGMEWARRCAI
jgi:uncharacterized protein CbrC (UPF0167 family)